MNIPNDRKVILYGDKRYAKDFMYLFDNIKVDEVIEDAENKAIQNRRDALAKKIGQPEKPFIIVCKYDEEAVCCDLERANYVRNHDYVSASDCFENLDFPIKSISKHKKIYIWGTGERGKAFLRDFLTVYPEVEIPGYIDSDKEKMGKTFIDKPIYGPEDVIHRENIFIIVATTMYYVEIKKILHKNGKVENKDFVHMYAINQWPSHLAKQTIYDTPKANFLCKRPFKFAELGNEGRMTCCCGIPNLGEWNVPVYYSEFNNVWHSNVMKVIRLSMINGTYTFCNPLKCQYVYDCTCSQADSDYYGMKEDDYPRTLQCSFDKSCNLHCVSCRKNVYMASGIERERLNGFAKYLRTDVFPNIVRLKFAGGETCVSPTYDQIIFDPTSDIREIAILSNGQHLSKDYVDRLERQYDKIDIMVSMDGAHKDTAEKLRRGIDFECWKQNMRVLGEKRAFNKIHMLAFTFVVQKDNFKEMVEFAKMCLGFNADYIRFSRLMNWGQYSKEEYEALAMCDSLGNMKPELKDAVSNEIFNRPEIKLFEWVEWFI